jgi:hypothetical protein
MVADISYERREKKLAEEREREELVVAIPDAGVADW